MLFKIYLKELKDSFRDRRTLIYTVFIPIIMMTGLLFVYENLLSGGTGTYTLAVSEKISSDEETIFSHYENIEMVKTLDPLEMVENGEAHAAVLFTPDFNNNVKQGHIASVTLIGNSFSQNSTILMNIVSNALANYEKTIITNRLTTEGLDLSLITPFTIEQKEISNENQEISLLAILLPLVLGTAIAVGSSPAASDLFAGEKEKKTMEALLMTPVNRSVLFVAKWLSISSIGAIIGFITLIVLAVEIRLFTENLRMAVSFDENSYLLIFVALLITLLFAMLVASLLMIASIIAKTVKESQSYSTPITMSIVFPVMIIGGIGINEFSFGHFAIPIMNLFSILKELLYGVINWEHIAITVVSNILCIMIAFIIARILFLKDRWVMN